MVIFDVAPYMINLHLQRQEQMKAKKLLYTQFSLK